MEAGKACDALGLAPGCAVEQADAEQAYVQARLGGDAQTWVRLPRERQPASWSRFKDPVCPLILALYGHPDSGGYWEAHCTKALVAAGFAPVAEWPSCFVHAQLALFLVVYVDDFKLAGPVSNLAKGWKLIRRDIKMDDPTPLDKYLGCEHREFRAFLDVRGDPRHALFVWPPDPIVEDPTASARGGGPDGQAARER